eukprot:m.428956 g.428956  ORF g.428956 m.428956 type:complete len:316 (+) comp56712_c0_seq1:319-1266(+)
MASSTTIPISTRSSTMLLRSVPGALEFQAGSSLLFVDNLTILWVSLPSNFTVISSKVYVPYCSSDSWSGDSAFNSSASPYVFRGRRIMQFLMTELLQNQGLGNAQTVVITGCSAGARGALFNIDSLCSLVSTSTRCVGLFDAAWWVEENPYDSSIDSLNETVVLGAPLWNASVLMDRCATLAAGPVAFAQCFFSFNAIKYVQTPFLMHSEQFDAFQIPYNIGHSYPFNSSEMAYIDNLRTMISASIAGVQAPNRAWSAACYQHCITLGPTFWQIAQTASGESLSASFATWLINGDTDNQIDTCTAFNCSPGCPAV